MTKALQFPLKTYQGTINSAKSSKLSGFKFRDEEWTSIEEQCFNLVKDSIPNCVTSHIESLKILNVCVYGGVTVPRVPKMISRCVIGITKRLAIISGSFTKTQLR